MKKYIFYILVLCFGASFDGFSQNGDGKLRFDLMGLVQMKETLAPISGVSIATSHGQPVFTDAFGAFKIRTAVGEQLVIGNAGFKTVTLQVKSREELRVLLENYTDNDAESTAFSLSRRSATLHQSYLDSAEIHKKNNIAKSIDFVARSIAELGKVGNKKELAKSLSTLGEIYLFHKQYDLAIDNFEDALQANKTIAMALLLGKTYVSVKACQKAENVINPLIELKNMAPYQRVGMYELLGDAKKGLDDISGAVAFYNEGLKVAGKNQISPKMTDLTSKIADAYVQGNQLVEAEAFYGNSMELATQLAPKRALQEKEKVADFYNKKSQFKEEIALRIPK